MDTIKHNTYFRPSSVEGTVAVIGCGAVGSWTALQLYKLGLKNVLLIDGDKVEQHNLCNQLYGPRDVGIHKVSAMQRLVHTLTDCDVKDIPILAQMIDHPSLRHLINAYKVQHVIACVDSMAARKSIYGACRYSLVRTLYDARMGATGASLTAFDPSNEEKCKVYVGEMLYDDEEVVHDVAACGTIQSIGSTAMSLASQIVWSFMQRHAAGDKPVGDIYEHIDYSVPDLSVHLRMNDLAKRA